MITFLVLILCSSVLSQDDCAEWNSVYPLDCTIFEDVMVIDQSFVDTYFPEGSGTFRFSGIEECEGLVFVDVDAMGIVFEFPDLTRFTDASVYLRFDNSLVGEILFPLLDTVMGISIHNTTIGEGLIFPMLVECAGSFHLDDSQFANIDMPNLMDIRGDFVILGNRILGGIDMPLLENVGIGDDSDFQIINNDISSIGTFESLRTIGKDFYLQGNTGLSEMVNAFNSLAVTGNIEIKNNTDMRKIAQSFNSKTDLDTSTVILLIENNDALENITNSFGYFKTMDTINIDNPSLKIFGKNFIWLRTLRHSLNIDVNPASGSFLNCQSLRVLSDFMDSMDKITVDFTFRNCPESLVVENFFVSLGSDHEDLKFTFSNFSATKMINILPDFSGNNPSVIFDIDVVQYTTVLVNFSPNNPIPVLIDEINSITGDGVFFKSDEIKVLSTFLSLLAESEEFVIHANKLEEITYSFQRLRAFDTILLDTPALRIISKSFNSITDVNHFYISTANTALVSQDIQIYCGSLETITNSFSDITAINDFVLDQCPLIRAIDQIAQRVTSMNLIQIEDNDILFGLGESFHLLEDVGDLILKNNPSFRTVPDFQNLQSLTTLSLINSKLDRLYLLEVVSIKNEVKIQDNELLDLIVRTSPFPISVGSIYLVNNPRLRGMPFNVSAESVPIVFGNNLLCDEIIKDERIQCCGDNETNSLNNEFCDSGNDQGRCNANCNECGINYFGVNCLQSCTCDSGFCDYGITGGGSCVSCYTGYFGKDCKGECTCFRGTCDDGLDGDGTCSICFTNYYGINCEKYCFCGEGDCDYETGVCLDCNEGYFGTNCHVKKKVNRKVFPVINCITPIQENNEYIAYIGYANTDSDSIPGTQVESKFLCGGDETEIELPIDSYKPGQHNFIRKVTCHGNLVWELNLTSVTILDTELEEYYCGKMDQRFVIPIVQQSDENKREEIKNLIIDQLDMSDVSINEIIRNSTNKRTISYELLATFSVGNNTEDGSAAEAIYQYASGISTLDSIDIIDGNTAITYLTFNETVGLNEEEAEKAEEAEELVTDSPQNTTQGIVTIVVIIAIASVFLSTIISLFVGVSQIRKFICLCEQ